MNNLMTHQQEHEDLSIKLSEAKQSVQTLYEEFHNGDKKMNKIIMNCRDTISDASVMLQQHKARTAGSDQKVERYGVMVKALWIVGTAFIVSMVKHIVDMI